MYHRYRRNFLKGMLTGAAAPAIAQAASFNFQPDARATVGGKQVPVDIALLGDRGEPTAGFYASLDPFHGHPFSPGWNAVYRYYFSNPRSTDTREIERVITHVTIHGVKRAELEAVYGMAKNIWDTRLDLRVNAPRP